MEFLKQFLERSVRFMTNTLPDTIEKAEKEVIFTKGKAKCSRKYIIGENLSVVSEALPKIAENLASHLDYIFSSADAWKRHIIKVYLEETDNSLNVALLSCLYIGDN